MPYEKSKHLPFTRSVNEAHLSRGRGADLGQANQDSIQYYYLQAWQKF